MNTQIEVGDIVLVPCRVVGKCLRAYSNDNYIIDVRPIEHTSGETYCESVIKTFSVDQGDIARS